MKKINDVMATNPIYISTADSKVAEGNPFPLNSDNGAPGQMNYSMTVG